MTLTQAQLDLRRQGISSSDLPAILGMDPFGKGPFALWMEKVHPEQVTPKTGQELEIGQRLEPFVAHWCSELYEPLIAHGRTVLHDTHLWMICTPDYINAASSDTVPVEPWEIKAWMKDPGDYVEAQVRWQMAVLNAPIGHIGWWRRSGYDPPEHRIIERDFEAEALMIEKAREFWFDYVLTKKEPPTDASDECSRYFAQKKSSQALLSVDENHPITQSLLLYKEACERVECAELLKAETSNKLKRMIYELDRVSTPIGDMSYVWHKGKTSVAWEMAMREFAEMVKRHIFPNTEPDIDTAFNDLVKKHTTEKPGYRQLHPKWSV